MKKSPFFRMKEKYGGGVTSQQEITQILNFLFSKGLFERTKVNGEFMWKQKEGVLGEQIEKALADYKGL